MMVGILLRELRDKAVLKGKGIAEKDIPEALIAVSSPAKQNSPALEAEDLRAIRARKDTDPAFDVEQALAEHVAKYAFLGYREPFASGYAQEFFRERLEGIEERKETLTTPIPAFNREEQAWVDLLKEFVYFRTYRTEKLYEGLFYLEKLWDALSAQYGLSEHALAYYLLSEVEALFAREEKVADEVIAERKAGYGLLLHDNTLSLITGARLRQKKDAMRVQEEVKELKGVTARKGIARGTARIILEASEQERVREGDILITSMTTPNFLPAMRRATAFATDEGGITCHAAIVAREMGKPCIIDTKIATQVLKDGDLVEVDAESGVVRIVRRE